MSVYYEMFPDECPAFADGGPHLWVTDWKEAGCRQVKVVYCDACGATPDTRLSPEGG